MTPYEIMLSESQERMLLVAEKGREHEVLAVFKKWGLDAVVVGHVTEGGIARPSTTTVAWLRKFRASARRTRAGLQSSHRRACVQE